MLNLVKTEMFLSVQLLILGTHPVSYTHLDVYKRQEHKCQNPLSLKPKKAKTAFPARNNYGIILLGHGSRHTH